MRAAKVLGLCGPGAAGATVTRFGNRHPSLGTHLEPCFAVPPFQRGDGPRSGYRRNKAEDKLTMPGLNVRRFCVPCLRRPA
jgi:hypothetical protein